MSTISRARAVVGSLYALMRNRLGLNVATPLGAQELSCTVAPDRRLVVLGHEPIAGFPADHGTVADEAAMLALHTLDSITLLTEPRVVVPGDIVRRADSPGAYWLCIRGHGQLASDWITLPSLAALLGYVSSLSSDIAGKWSTPPNAAVLAALAVEDGALTLDGVPVGAGPGSARATAAIDWDAAVGCYDASGVAAADGVAVGRWDDSSGNGLYVTATDAAMPTYRASGLGAGVPAVEFDASDDSMATSCYAHVLSRASGFEALAVLARLSTSVESLLLAMSWGSGRVDLIANHTWSILDYADFSDHRLAGAVPALDTTAPVILGARFDGGRMAISVNGVDALTRVSTTPASLPPATVATLTLGRHGRWSYGQGACRLGRLLVWDRALRPAERAEAVAALAEQYGITLG